MKSILPNIRFEQWNLFGGDIALFLKYPKVPEIIEKRAIDNLKLVDEVLAVYEEALPDASPLLGLYETTDKSIKKQDISLNYLEFMWNYCLGLDPNEEYSKVSWNAIKDLRRVIKRRLNNEPLYLIQEQFNFFMDFTNYLSSAPRKRL
jgi:hypothetical protein